ncbi:MAG: IS200/IS605 family transposase [Prevotellaceae bacterium]|jgi:putative transposase|nr:IS200/IS605 family transposase [Prevotellaceae bacterium]
MENRYSANGLQIHLVWITKYRYQVLQGKVQLRCRDILREVRNSMDIQIIKSVASKDFNQLHLSYPPQLSFIEIVRRLKGLSSRLLLQEFLELKRRYWGNLFWGIAYG